MTLHPTPADVTFLSRDDQCAAWHFAAIDDALAGPAGRPIAVMAHGLGGTKDSGLAPFAEGLAAAGLDVLAFDYRGFGASGGVPRQTVSIARQVDDYRAAMAAAKRLPGVDPDRLVLWGVSLAGGHVLEAGAGRDDVAAVVSLTPLVSGAAAGRLALAHHKPTSILRSTVAGVRSRVGNPVMMPIVGRPGDVAALTLDGCYEAYTALAGPTWRNEVDAAVGLELGGLRPGRFAKELTCPLFVQIADFDRSAPPYAAAKVAFQGRAQVRHYPCDHFDVWPGAACFDRVLAHQVAFLRRVFSPLAEPALS
ncbi:MAG: alpha/beta hydrolase [Actinomycetota bacterium]|nr:alpha/beta hydrolase [Actinomycetota bacterium]